MSNVSDDRLQPEYDAAMKVWTQLVDVRFKLLAITPIATGLALKGRPTAPIGALGLVVALAIVGYEIRNSQLHDNAVHRLMWLEKQLHSPSSVTASGPSGIIGDSRAGERLKVVHFVKVRHDRALAGVYGATVGAWAAIVTEGVAKHWATWSVGRWFSFGVGAVSAAITALTITRASTRGRAVAPVENLHRKTVEQLKDVATVVTHATNRWTEPDKSTEPIRSAESVKLAEQLGVIERHEQWISPSRKPAPGDWWVSALNKANSRRKPEGQNALPDPMSRATMPRLRRRSGVRIRSPKVTVRRTPWGELLATSPTVTGAAERERLLREHFQTRVIGSELLVDEQLGALGIIAAGTGGAARGATASEGIAPPGRDRGRPSTETHPATGRQTFEGIPPRPGAPLFDVGPRPAEPHRKSGDIARAARLDWPFGMDVATPPQPNATRAGEALPGSAAIDLQAGFTAAIDEVLAVEQSDLERFLRNGRRCPPC